MLATDPSAARAVRAPRVATGVLPRPVADAQPRVDDEVGAPRVAAQSALARFGLRRGAGVVRFLLIGDRVGVVQGAISGVSNGCGVERGSRGRTSIISSHCFRRCQRD